jgi:hypothetical protein
VISWGVRLELPVADAVWTRDMELEVAPFPGLGIRIDTYDVLNVSAVRVAAAGQRVTCVVGLEDAAPGPVSAAVAESFGFAPESPETEGIATGLSAMLVTYAAEQMWCKQIRLPFAPFAGLQVEVGGHVLSVFSVVVKDRLGDVACTCLASFDGEDAAAMTEYECVALGFEECVYP